MNSQEQVASLSQTEREELVASYTKKCKTLLIITVALTAVYFLLTVLKLDLGEAAMIPMLISGITGGLLILNGNTRKALLGGRGISGYAMLGILFGGFIIPLLTSLVYQFFQNKKNG